MAIARSVWRRNRGLALALVIVSTGSLGYSWLPPNGPRVSWRERFTPIESKEAENGLGTFDAFSKIQPWDHDGGQFLPSPDGKAILTIFHDHAKVRDVETGRVVELKCGESAEGLRHRMVQASFLAGGRFLIGVIAEGDESEGSPVSLKVYEIPSGRERDGFNGIVDGSNWPAFAVSRDGSTLAFSMGTPGPPTVGVWNVVEDRPPAYFAGKGPIALSDDGRVLALVDPAGSEGKLRVWDVRSTECLASIAVSGADESKSIALSPDGKTLAELREGKTNLWDVATSSIKQVLPTDLIGSDPWYSPDGSIFFLWKWGWDGIRPIEAWDLSVNPPHPFFRGHGLDLSLDGHRLVQLGPNFVDHPELEDRHQSHPTQRVVELPSMKPLGRTLEPWASSIILSPDRRRAAMMASRYEPSWAKRLTDWLPLALRPTSPSFGVSKREDEVRVIDVETGKALTTVKLFEKSINFDSIARIRFVGDGKTLALHRWMPPEDPTTPGYDELVELWDIPGPPSKWPILGGLAGLALVVGRWSDVRSGRRGVSASLST